MRLGWVFLLVEKYGSMVPIELDIVTWSGKK